MTLTTADIDEWLALVDPSTYSDGSDYPSFFPYEWARDALGGLLGQEVPWRRYAARETRELLTRARTVVGCETLVTETYEQEMLPL